MQNMKNHAKLRPHSCKLCIKIKQATSTHMKGPRLRSTNKSPKNPLKFGKFFFFGSGHQNGSPHIKSCSTDKRRQQIIHEKSHTKSSTWRYKEKFSWRNYDHTRKGKQEESYVKKSCMKKPNKIMYVKKHKDQLI